MRLYLLRHGEAEPYGRGPDAERSLVEAGRRAVRQKRPRLEPVEAFYCSPYRRARQTAEIVQPAVGHLEPRLDDRLTPDQPVEGVLALLQSLDVESCLIVGHNPLLSQTASVLVGERHGMTLPTAGLVCLQAEDWYPGGATLQWLA